MIYLEHFGLREAPFGITPDTSFFCACRSIEEALTTLEFAAANGEGFIKITGEVGTGKTLLCRKFLAMLGPDWVAAYLPNPNVNSRTLLFALAEELGCRPESHLDEHTLMKTINGRLLAIADAGKRAIVCIDEAQVMSIKTMETVRLLTNLETEKRKLLQVVLFGQPELDEKLALPEIRQLRQRITFEYRLVPLTREETGHYLAHRMIVGGYGGGGAFSSLATRAIHGASGGVPRLVNILAHKTLMLAYGRGARRAGWREAHTAARDTPAAVAPPRRALTWLGLAGISGLIASAGWLAAGWLP
jgi:MSHA biogenesis protein MshM